MHLLVWAAAAGFPHCAHAHGAADPAKARTASVSTEQHAFGVQGNPRSATRTIRMSMDDSMHYSVSRILVTRGETVTFVISNKGRLLHELVLGTEDDLNAHAQMMRKYPGMEHDEPYMAHVKPGRTERITWKFDKPGTFMYACLVAGHFEAGMKGTIVVAAK
jgi:uncharacterized cupredoxin-like copper-binding protein